MTIKYLKDINQESNHIKGETNLSPISHDASRMGRGTIIQDPWLSSKNTIESKVPIIGPLTKVHHGICTNGRFTSVQIKMVL